MDNLRPSHQIPRSIPALTNDDIEAVIQLATSSRSSADGRAVPLKDTRTQLFVGNLPYRVRWQDLKDLFRRAGTVLRADVSLGPDNRSRGYGTVLLATAEDAGRAIDMFNGYSWQTRILEVRPDRLPPDFDANIAPGYPVAGSGPVASNIPTTTPFPDDLDYSSLLDHYYNLPSASNPPSRNLFVGNLPFHCQWQDLKDLFRQAGTIIRADVALGQDGRSRGFGTVVYATEQDAEHAVQLFNGYEYNGRPLKVNYDKYMQLVQPNALVPNITGTSLGSRKSPASPTPSVSSSAPDSRISTLPHARPVSSYSQSGKHSTHPLDLAPTSNASLYERWGSQLALGIPRTNEQDREREAEERERDLLRSFHQLHLESRPASTRPIPLHPPAASRSASASSSTKPPSQATTTSSRSTASSSSSVAASASTANTSDNSEPLFDRRQLQPSSRPVGPTSSSKSPSLQPNRRRSNQQLSSHHPSPHPHHPGPITIPPPPPVTAFPLGHAGPHSVSPHGMMHISLSPLHHPLGSPSSPNHHPHHQHPQYQQQISSQVLASTPHGLPPITPSMPPFNFLPPPPTAANTTGPSLPQTQPTMSTPSMQTDMPMNLMHPSKSHPRSDEQRRHPFSLTSINASPFAQTPPAINAGNNGNHINGYAPSPSAFSPGAMSPGAFWGRPGTSAVNPMINPAVGAPVHMQHGGNPSVHLGHMHSPVHHAPMHSPGYSGHLHSPGHGDMFFGSGGLGMCEPAGYFDPGYFPPMGYPTGDAGTGTSFVEDEILKPKDRSEGDKGDGAVGRKTPQEDTSEGEGIIKEERPSDDAERSRASSAAEGEVTSGATDGDGDTRGWEGRERRVTAGLTREPDAMVISRTQSMSSKTPAASRMFPVHRSESEPATIHPHAADIKGKNSKLRADDIAFKDAEGPNPQLKHGMSVS